MTDVCAVPPAEGMEDIMCYKYWLTMEIQDGGPRAAVIRVGPSSGKPRSGHHFT